MLFTECPINFLLGFHVLERLADFGCKLTLLNRLFEVVNRGSPFQPCLFHFFYVFRGHWGLWHNLENLSIITALRQYVIVRIDSERGARGQLVND